ncbi:CDGSH iron-sulfur domain-containing protein [Mitsuaria sp. 7]|uniref:CDGSH iron-sulfur domain-containing protein n=1 Tax=Mitsuaria sp. 7 TaxID=1658665 RepID=UPI0007DD8952|nr:CDGSH iron-sulfur domain-containing protein [Mitsuaria sp. 7]ANH66630.1 iron-binding protein [Mitsuaria sp. 7]
MAVEVESYAGKDVTISIVPDRCIHSRNCVLGRPDVWVPNAEGPWVHPDAAPAETVAAIAESCPSGAIQYERHDGGPQEAAPLVNVVRIRENGPYAFHAELNVNGDTSSTRATLCRCGASRNKPYCDGSHHEAGFKATGEPATLEFEALSLRNGALTITPLSNGPLRASGALEICAGTGRTVTRVGNAFLCRCGGSSKKPFCDGTHQAIGFTDRQ